MTRKTLAILFAILLPAILYGHPTDKINAMYWKKVKIPAEAKGNVSVTLEFFLPVECKGYLLCNRNGEGIKTSLLRAEGGYYRVFFNINGSDELSLAFLKDEVGHAEGMPNASGLLHTVKRSKEPFGSVDSIDSFMKHWAKSAFEGALFEEKVFCGNNLLGENKNTIHSYDGDIKIGKAGSYRFYSASTDASFILIDGKPVVSWPGRHDPWKGANNEVFGDVVLAEGIHKFRYLHANNGDWLCAVAGILLPGEKKNGVIPKNSFTDVYKASAGPLEDGGGKPVPEFSWDNRQMIYFDSDCMHEVEFTASVPADLKVQKIKWDFDDGTSGEGAKVSHLYFKRWMYHVTMTVELAGGRQMKQKQDVQVNYRFGQSENDDNLTNEIMKKAVQQESSGGIQDEGYNAIITSMIFYKQKKEAETFYQKSSLMKKSPATERLFDFLDKLVVARMAETENYKAAIDAWDAFLQKAQEPMKSRALLKKAELLVGPLGDPQKGLEILNGIRNASLSDREKRAYIVAQSDAVLRKEGFNAAYYILNSIKTGNPVPKDAKERLERENSTNAKLFLVEQYIASNKNAEALEVISALEWEKPSIRLYAPLVLLKGRAFSKLGRNVMSVAVLEGALLLDRDDSTDAKIRIALAGVYAGRKEYLKAKQQISTIRKQNPNSLEELEASKLLEVINKKISEGAK
ncbi:MAG TPA: hypothetical protein DCZ94_14280 [Lentisphaeria bacterium]|nr:MAG: hypothetical protein A2X48_01755 [Lentisphaerae bacterium GWF2_49_21]HBC88114.1 hypothetical protein [Lentisphaeria bacterium]